MKEAFEECPQFIKCSVNKCPLDSKYPNRLSHDLDKEKKCRLSQAYRNRIGKRYKNTLKYEGLTLREFNSKLRWENLPEDEKERIRKRAFEMRANQKKGVFNVRV